ncbi:SAM-dependent methyltransferase [Nocardioides sp. GY 10127]|uniref:class I SAM-dependent methyltransferase n=1 Tax=Nocardioides sp. GY 10127 TaxID=2569762 RepID=UPI0010A799F1|nr:SAM-dependent methyltransferase [Nocardioides sp. GY 10127]TIC79929.1 SAM-dependent methyltransferase [Nocardioides sp. GY 10127]
MAEPLLRALNRLREDLLSDERLVRAVASGRRRTETPRWRRVELRYVDLKAGRHLQVTAYDERQAHTSNHLVRGADGEPSTAARDALDDLLEEPFGNWHVETTTHSHQLRVTKKGEALVHSAERTEAVEPDRGHDQEKKRLLEESDPVFAALGITDAQGRVKPTRRAKLRQVEEFVRLLDATITEALEKKHLRTPTAEDPLRLVDLGCGNAYLTFAAHRFLTHVRGLPVRVVGADVKQQSADHNTEVARSLGIPESEASFVVGSIEGVELDPAPEVVLALHACDTATDDALARGIAWAAPVVLAAPCCHHDVAAQLRRAATPGPYAMLTRHGILRERFADTLTDALRASLLRLEGYRVDVVEFVESEHTPRNTLLRAVRTGAPVRGGGVVKEYEALVGEWGITPRLAELLGRVPSDA